MYYWKKRYFQGTLLPGCFCESMSVIKTFRQLTTDFWNSCCDEVLQENAFDKAFFKKSSNLENLPVNNQNLVLVKEFILYQN